jgi:hypothetical protein
MIRDIGINWKNICWNIPMQHSVMVSARIVQRTLYLESLDKKNSDDEEKQAP